MPHTIKNRETATILAALRYWQRNVLNPGPLDEDLAEWDIATNGGEHTPLSSGKIDRLCERINCGCEADASF